MAACGSSIRFTEHFARGTLHRSCVFSPLVCIFAARMYFHRSYVFSLLHAGPCYACPPSQHNPVAGGNCSSCVTPNTQPNASRTGCSCLPGYKEAHTTTGVLEKCVLANLTCPAGTDYDARGTSCIPNELPFAEPMTADKFTVLAGQWANLDVLQNGASADAGGGSIELALQPKVGKAVVSGSVIRYLAKAGTLGIDSFNYTYVAKSGMRSTATVTLNITASSCSPNMCGLSRAAGECDAARAVASVQLGRVCCQCLCRTHLKRHAT
jgi:hypothetical protein